ncbi:MAG TPA: DUF2007 domain-containing protein [Salinimicrobium sp.]|nr:DUF2007 domain-containing protein [Salinimicrobium sp.]
MENTNFIRIYTGLEPNVDLLQDLFRTRGIDSVTRNDFEAGLRAGFGGGFPGQVQLFAHKDHYDEALNIVKETFPGEEVDERKNDPLS